MPITKRYNGTVWKPCRDAPKHDTVVLPRHYQKGWCSCKILKELRKDKLLVTALLMEKLIQKYEHIIRHTRCL